MHRNKLALGAGIGCLGVLALFVIWLLVGLSYSPGFYQDFRDRFNPPPTPFLLTDLPVPVYPGATLVNENYDKSSPSLTRYYTTSAEPEDVVRFFEGELPKYGWGKCIGQGEWLCYNKYYEQNENLYILQILVGRDGSETSIQVSLDRQYKA